MIFVIGHAELLEFAPIRMYSYFGAYISWNFDPNVNSRGSGTVTTVELSLQETMILFFGDVQDVWLNMVS